MPDIYPDLAALPAAWLVPAQDQPDYLEPPGVELGFVDLGSALSDALVDRGLGGATAIVHHESGRTLTYGELATVTSRAAGALAGLGVRPGDRVALKGPNCPEILIAAIATWKLGAVVVPVPALSREKDLRFYLQDTTAAVLLIASDDSDAGVILQVAREQGVGHVVAFGTGEIPSGAVSWIDALAAAPIDRAREAIPLDSVAIIWHTGGTTGTPKGCYHTQRRFLLAGHSFGLASQVGPGQRWMAAAPIGHALGMIYHTIFTLLHGATIVIAEKFTDPVVLLQAIDANDVTTFTAITASWAGMHAAIERGDAAAPTSLVTGYAMWQSSSSTEVADWWKAHGVTLLNNFGSTAFATWVLVPQGSGAVPQGSLGRPAPGYQVRVLTPQSDDEHGEQGEVDDGEIGQLAIRGPSGLTYWRLPEKQRSDVRGGWVVVDDLVQLEAGNYRYLGRTDFLISCAGNKISPGEVESVLAGHPAVQEVLVIGLPDPIRQEVVSAFVVLGQDFSPSGELKLELQNLVKKVLSPYKYPRIVEFIDALPRDHVGKVQPKVMKERVLARMQEAGS